jgi:hypothetical protein
MLIERRDIERRDRASPLLLALSLCVCTGCSSARQPHLDQQSSANPQALEEQLATILMSHAPHHPVLDSASRHAKSTLESILAGSWAVGEVNAPYRKDRISVYLVDAQAAEEDPAACGHWLSSFDIPPSQRDVCYRLRRTRDNCVVLATNIVACDIRLVWRLNRYASILAIASLKKPGLDEYYFPRAEVRRTFLIAEAKYKRAEDLVANLQTLDESFAQKFQDVGETRDRVFQGFLAFILSHEGGHILRGHATGGALPPCALGSGATSTIDARHLLCGPTSNAELDADREAVQFLAQNVSASAFTPARATPELFVEEHERRRFHALQQAGLSPSWTPEFGTDEEKSRFNDASLVALATGTHPKDLQRYLLLLAALEERGVTLAASRVSADIARDELHAITEFCRSRGAH